MCKMYVGESGPVLDFSQHSHFELGESGLKATSMTTMVGAEILGRVPLRSTTFVLDRPFLVLVVRESNDALLYVAAISDPIPLAK